MSSRSERCEVRVGRLIAHPCGRSGTARCDSCGKLACANHRDRSNRCGVCAGTIEESKAAISLDQVGDPMDFAPEIYGAFEHRAGAPDDELAGVDS